MDNYNLELSETIFGGQKRAVEPRQLGATVLLGLPKDWMIALLIVLLIKILDYLDLRDLVAAAVHRMLAVAGAVRQAGGARRWSIGLETAIVTR